jgi:hypothetical protein
MLGAEDQKLALGELDVALPVDFVLVAIEKTRNRIRQIRVEDPAQCARA